MAAKPHNMTCMKFCIVLSVLLGLAGPAVHAEDLTLVDGRVYNDVKVTAVTADGIEITHAAGAKIIKFNELPPEEVKKYQEEGQKMAEARKKKAAAEAAAAKTTAPAPKQEPQRPLIYSVSQLDDTMVQAKKEGKIIALLAGDDEYLKPTDKNAQTPHAAFQHYGSLLQNSTILIYSHYTSYDWHAVSCVNKYVHENFQTVPLPIVFFCAQDLSEVYGHVPYIKNTHDREREIQKMLRASRNHIPAPTSNP